MAFEDSWDDIMCFSFVMLGISASPFVCELRPASPDRPVRSAEVETNTTSSDVVMQQNGTTDLSLFLLQLFGFSLPRLFSPEQIRLHPLVVLLIRTCVHPELGQLVLTSL